MSRPMNCPFPGMDPFLEDRAFWPDFHAKFINYWQEYIADRVPEHYDVRVGERVYIVAESSQAAQLTGPSVVREEMRVGYIQILHLPNRELVTTLELLSPGNKKNPGRQSYVMKRNALLCQNVHIVELDLLLKGHRLPLDKPCPHGDYFYFVSHSDRRPNCDVYSWGLRDPLPTVPVPLQSGDVDVICDLAVVFATAFERGRYRASLRYGKALPTNLGADNLQWIKETLAAAKE
jgi:hypothetical protein